MASIGFTQSQLAEQANQYATSFYAVNPDQKSIIFLVIF